MEVNLAKILPFGTNPYQLCISAAKEPFAIPEAVNPISPKIGPNIFFKKNKFK